MDKEKQIEEMAQCIDCTPFLFEKDIKNCVYLKQGIGCDRYKFAKENYDKGYRKINENEVVISKEEYHRLKIDGLTKSRLTISDRIKLVEKARLKTAGEILRDLYYEATSNITDTIELTILQIEELAEKYGVDLGEEVCKN